MKTVFFTLGALLAFAAFPSCEKGGKHRLVDTKEKPHPYQACEDEDESATDVTWYDEDGNGYYALFTLRGMHVLPAGK